MELIVVPGGESQISKQFLQGMINRMIVGSAKYGDIRNQFPNQIDAIGCLKLRLEKYEATGNTEWLMDAANYCMIEFMLPKHPEAHFRPTDSKESPGRISEGEVRKL